jgi:hypothetical protein
LDRVISNTYKNMKKLLIGIGSMLILAFVAVLFVNADDLTKDSKKAKTEVIKDEAGVPCSATCAHATEHKTVPCNPEKCKEINCVHKDGKCDPTTCTAHKEGEPKEGTSCMKATTCPGKCHSKTE